MTMEKEPIKMKKILALTIIGLFLLSMFAFVVMAKDDAGQGNSEEEGGEENKNFISRFIDITNERVSSFGDSLLDLMENRSESDKPFFEREWVIRSLLFVLVFLFISTIVAQMKLMKGFKAILTSVIISILSFVYIPNSVLIVALNPFTALGAALLGIIPFLLVFFFAHNMLSNTFLRRITWIFFSIYLIVLTLQTLYTQEATQTLLPLTYAVITLLSVSMIFWYQHIDDWFREGSLMGKVNDELEKVHKRVALDRVKDEEAEERGLSLED